MGTPKEMLKAGLLRFGATTALTLLSKTTIRSAIRGQIRKLITGNREKPSREIPSVERTSDRIVKIMRGKIPASACIGIDGIAGGGKSTLARSLSRKMGLKKRTLHSREMDAPLEFNQGMIYENIRLFRTQDIDCFDAILYIDMPVRRARIRVLERDRNGALVDFLDFEMLKRIGDLCFEVADGEQLKIPESCVRMKIRPARGYRTGENLASKLEESGLRSQALSKEEMLFLLCYGEARKGIRPYLKLGAYNRDMLEGLLSGVYAVLYDVS